MTMLNLKNGKIDSAEGIDLLNHSVPVDWCVRFILLYPIRPQNGLGAQVWFRTAIDLHYQQLG